MTQTINRDETLFFMWMAEELDDGDKCQSRHPDTECSGKPVMYLINRCDTGGPRKVCQASVDSVAYWQALPRANCGECGVDVRVCWKLYPL